jgi:hypothetical protein
MDAARVEKDHSPITADATGRPASLVAALDTTHPIFVPCVAHMKTHVKRGWQGNLQPTM